MDSNLESKVKMTEEKIYGKMSELASSLRNKSVDFNKLETDFSIEKDGIKVKVFKDGKYMLEQTESIKYFEVVKNERSFWSNGGYSCLDRIEKVTFRQLYGKDHKPLAHASLNENINVMEHDYYMVEKKGEGKESVLYNPENMELARGNNLRAEVFPDGKILIQYEKEQRILGRDGKIMASISKNQYECKWLAQAYEDGGFVLDDGAKKKVYDADGVKIAETTRVFQNIVIVGKGFYAIQPSEGYLKIEKGMKKEDKIPQESTIYDWKTGETAQVGFLVEKAERLQGNKLKVEGYRLHSYEKPYEYWEHHQCNDQSPVCTCYDTHHSGYNTVYKKSPITQEGVQLRKGDENSGK